jgi:hypothetical protein
MCDERGGVSDPEFPFALPELGALIAASPRIVASGPTRADASRANTPTGASYHDGIERYRSSIDQGVWPPVDFNGEFDALGVDVRALAPASAEDETPFPEVPDWLATEDRDVFEAFRGEFAEQRHGPFADLCDFGTENTNDRRIASSPRSHARSPRHIRVPSSSVTREEKHLSAAPTTRVRPPEDSPIIADDEIDDVSDDEAADDESAMRRAMRRSPRYPALLEAYFRCATVGASATRVAAAERRKRKLLERAARARDDGARADDVGGRPTGHTFGSVPSTEPVPGSGSGSGSSSSSHSSKCSRWRDRRGEVGERGPGAEAASPQTPTGVFFCAGSVDAGSVDAFMAECVSEMEAYAEDLLATYREAEDACAAFEARVATLGRLTLKSDDEDDAVTRNGVAGHSGGCLSAPLPSTDDATTTNSTDDGRTRPGATPKRGALPTVLDGVPAPPPSASETLRETLKRKYAASILTLKDEFLKKRKKGKLPAAATEALKRWWRARVAWPYPSEEEKRALGAETRLDPTQINNWFINQRKRHWHKLFEGGVPPAAEAEARAALVERFGSIQAAIDGALGDA